MGSGTLTQFSCDGCGKTYRWKPELAGRKVKCKCGQAMHVPAPPAPAAAESDDPFADALSEMAAAEEQGTTRVIAEEKARCPSCACVMESGAVLCVQCGYNSTTGKKIGMKVQDVALAPAPAKKASGAGPARPGAGILAYQRTAPPPARGRGAAGGDNNIGEPFKDLYLPIILFLGGVVLTYLEAHFALRIRSTGFAVGYTAVVTIIDLVLVFAGIMFATKLLDLGLGPIGPAILKIAAIAVLPGAVAHLISYSIAIGGDYIGWFVSLVLICSMFMGLLQLDFHETMICSTIIWLVRTWVGYAIAMAILSGFGLSIAAMAPIGGGGGSGPSTPAPPKPRAVTAQQLDAAAVAALGSKSAMEAKQWIVAGTDEKPHAIPIVDSVGQPEYVQRLYDMGAVKVTVTRTGKDKHSESIDARQIVIALPKDPAAREKLFDAGHRLARSFGFEFFNDKGQKYLLLDYDVQGPAEHIPIKGLDGKVIPDLDDDEGDL
jgi:hypothetical protein